MYNIDLILMPKLNEPILGTRFDWEELESNDEEEMFRRKVELFEMVLLELIKDKQNELYISSLDYSKLINIKHKNFLRDYRKLIKNDTDINPDYFKEATYINRQNKKQPHIIISSKGVVQVLLNSIFSKPSHMFDSTLTKFRNDIRSVVYSIRNLLGEQFIDTVKPNARIEEFDCKKYTESFKENIRFLINDTEERKDIFMDYLEGTIFIILKIDTNYEINRTQEDMILISHMLAYDILKKYNNVLLNLTFSIDILDFLVPLRKEIEGNITEQHFHLEHTTLRDKQSLDMLSLMGTRFKFDSRDLCTIYQIRHDDLLLAIDNFKERDKFANSLFEEDIYYDAQSKPRRCCKVGIREIFYFFNNGPFGILGRRKIKYVFINAFIEHIRHYEQLDNISFFDRLINPDKFLFLRKVRMV
jgi:phage regulator Rha-like protein